MKDRGEMTSLGDCNVLPSFPHHNSDCRPPPAHHDHRQNRKTVGGAGEQSWRKMPSLGADVNLLANSLTSRLRKAGRHKATPSSSSSSAGSTFTTTNTACTNSSSGSRSAPPEESVRKNSRSKRNSQSQVVPQSILKRTLSRDMAELQYQHDHRGGAHSADEDDLHLPDVFMTRRWSSSAGHLDRLEADLEGFNNQFLDRPTPTLAGFGGRGAGGGGGGGGGWVPSRTRASNGHVTWVKRAGIFQPADKYAPGRQNLHGDDQPYARSQTVDYETVTLSSRGDSPESDVLSGWSSGKGPRRKGLKVSWKQPSESSEDQEGDASRPTHTSMSRRQKSAGTVQSEPGTYSFVKPRFNPGKSRVPMVGVKWKVPTPTVGRPPSDSALEEARAASSGDASGHSTPTSTTSLPAASPRAGTSPSKPTAHTHDTRHPWRALHPRDVHPVTTALEREGTSVSKTKWQVPSVRPVPAYTFIEDLMESSGRQWHPHVQTHRLATRATVDAQSMQNRLKEGVSESSNDTVSSRTLSTTTDLEP